MLSERLCNLNWSGHQWYVVRTEFHEMCEIVQEFERVTHTDSFVSRSPNFPLKKKGEKCGFNGLGKLLSK
jgi:hypothetical protein